MNLLIFRQPSQSYQRPANMPVPQNELAESSRYLLDKAKSVRSRPMWEPGNFEFNIGLYKRFLNNYTFTILKSETV